MDESSWRSTGPTPPGDTEDGGAVVAASLREKLVKIGAKLVRRGRYVTFQMAEIVVPGQTFAEALALIARPGAWPAPA